MQENSSRKEAEKALATSLQNSEPEVLALLYDAYAPVLMGLITRIVRSAPTAELVLQETFLAIWQQRATYKPDQCGLLTWLIMVAKETALASLQNTNYSSAAAGTETQPATVKEQEITSSQPPETFVPKSFNQLNAAEKAVLDLIYLKGCSCAEAAANLGISEENLKITLRQAITHLRAIKP
ncbi:RNA polymerase sigma factor [Adhaeribacter pallidiroseus]|uniref:ECF RNA polymerase sigma factor SigK n=1 Tax=Adhaeribacter pallidiroseus TaxID=2072847 RepID=A0A369QH30_9BACT|nr:sigma-70 family RNA polymerase sigma factor [Adhaeribacter pallidiroseus]RDC62189.1 ECF RNA polymerase sigma factor SigK [Adhaeribacter pallidiroseus]